MDIKDAVALIEQTIKNKGSNGDTSFNLEFSSQLEQNESDDWIPRYRADLGYMYCGYFQSSIEGALISLAKELRRMGYTLE